jgi:acetyltransferase-like isoleucine patch superfamily enzyme
VLVRDCALGAGSELEHAVLGAGCRIGAGNSLMKGISLAAGTVLADGSVAFRDYGESGQST